MKLSRLCSALDGLEGGSTTGRQKGVRVFDFQERDIIGIAYDSRKVRPGYLFVAVPGSKADGHTFLREAVERGAVALVTEKAVRLHGLGLEHGKGTGTTATHQHETDTPGGLTRIVVPSSRKALACLSGRFYGEPSKYLTFIGITGTNGKTTISYLLRSILEASGKKVGLIGTVTCSTGQRCIPSSHTTPESLELHGLFKEMWTSGVTHVVMEVSSHALTQHRVHGIDFKAAIFTNLSQEHLDYHKDMETYREAKAVLFRSLSPEAVAVLNAEDSASQYLAQQTRAQVLWYYPKANKGIRGEIQGTSLEGTEVMLSDGKEELLVRFPLIGKYNFYNLLAASTTAHALGIGLSEIKRGVESLECPPGRLERIPGPGFHIFIDYAHTPHALEAALETLRPLVENRLLLVFGCGGDRDRGKRPLMGQMAERYADRFWLTSDNPRSEPPMQIIKEIERGINGKSYRVEPDRRLAIEQALSQAVKGDVVLIAGKGHEQTQDLGKLVIPFDDMEVVRQALSKGTARGKAAEAIPVMVEELQHAGSL
ncbi:MAG: UDP-N-acetylmuramoyl-L-alanyl-D-glutamate--2,6-diaminopimelate ligase [Planctomycetes bacterium]|nr:UDP-N-acetylmuramoyl-L-alanyl-D-glutamate--2,6-diaminopimelate ligase [Planctomycetota bacterium]